ncbi:MAG TPA: hypothetical protein VIU64_19815 [Polyangia bacterium]
MRSGVGLLLLGALAATGFGCKEKPRTEIIVGLATDLDAPAPLASVHLTVFSLPNGIPIGEATDRPLSGLVGEPYSLPGTYAIYSENGTPDRVRVRLVALDQANQILVVRTAVLSLVPERTLFVRLGLVSACVAKTDCAEGQTCVDGRCVSEVIDTSSLPTYEPGQEAYLTCASATAYVDTSTKKPLALKGAACASGLCAEGVCLTPPQGGAGGAGGAAGSSGGGAGRGGSPGQGGAGGAGVLGPAPQLTALSPMQGTAGTQVTLELQGQGIAAGWSVVFDGIAYPTTVVAGSDGPVARATIDIPTAIATGQTPVWLAAGNAVSNTLYFTVMSAPGAPTIVDYTPDNALPGTTVAILGTNLIAEPVTITDPAGRSLPVQATATTTWVGSSVDSVSVIVPADMITGAFTASNTHGSFRGRTFNVGQNLARLSGASAVSSTEYNTSNWSTASGWDNNLQTSWFSAHGDCASLTTCTKIPFFQINFPAAQTVSRIAMRGNREYASGYDFVQGRFEVLDAAGNPLWSEERLLPDPDRDLDIPFFPPLANAYAVRFTSLMDQSDEPGFSELEVF